MSMIEAAWAADVADARRILARRHDWYRQLGEPRQIALAAMYAEIGPVDAADWKKVADHAGKGEHQLASAAMLLSAWSRRAGQRAWRIAQVMRTGSDDPHKESRH